MINDYTPPERTFEESARWERQAQNAERYGHRPVTLDLDAYNALDERARVLTRLRINAGEERRTFSRTWVRWYEDGLDFVKSYKPKEAVK